MGGGRKTADKIHELQARIQEQHEQTYVNISKPQIMEALHDGWQQNNSVVAKNPERLKNVQIPIC